MKLLFYLLEVAFLLERKSLHHNPPETQKAQWMFPFCCELINKQVWGLVYQRKQHNNQSLPNEGRFKLSLGTFQYYCLPDTLAAP